MVFVVVSVDIDAVGQGKQTDEKSACCGRSGEHEPLLFWEKGAFLLVRQPAKPSVDGAVGEIPHEYLRKMERPSTEACEIGVFAQLTLHPVLYTATSPPYGLC
jgi:hypothetical protein